MLKIQTQGLCGEIVSVEETTAYAEIDLPTLTTLKCLTGTRADHFDAEHARKRGVYQLLRDRICPGCPLRRP
jgi:hypothetical protein